MTRELDTGLVTSSSRRGASAFGIAELLGLSHRRHSDVIVTSLPLPVSEVGHGPPSPSSDRGGGGTAPFRRRFIDVEGCAETSPEISLRRTSPVSLTTTSQRHADVTDDKQRCIAGNVNIIDMIAYTQTPLVR